MKYIYIFLTRTQSVVSKIVSFLSSETYTHAAIAFDEDLEQLYSSARKDGFKMFPAGPCQEHLDRGFYTLVGKTPCAIYRLEVSDEAYFSAKQRIEWFMQHQDEFKFNALGIVACKFGIPWERENKYFCSEFVAEILRQSKSAKLPKRNCLMRPSDYMSLPKITKVFEGDVGELNSRKKAKLATVI